MHAACIFWEGGGGLVRKGSLFGCKLEMKQLGYAGREDLAVVVLEPPLEEECFYLELLAAALRLSSATICLVQNRD